MTLIRTFTLALLLLAGAVVTFAQSEQASKSTALSDVTITVSILAKGIRFTALGSIGQMRLEVFNPSSDLLYNSEFKAGNVQDWALADKIGQPLADGSYQCVVTVRDVSGRLGMKQGTVLVQGGQASLKSGEGEQVGAVEPGKLLSPVSEGNETAITLLTHDGQQGRVVSGRGGLSFNTGDFFAGRDVEHMRLTAKGNLGIGVENPQAKLDVAGLIRTNEGIVFPDGTVQTTAYVASGRSLGERSGLRRDAQGRAIVEQDNKLVGAKEGLRFAPNISGSGTTGRITKWTDGPTGAVGDSALFEANGNIGLGTTIPTQLLHIVKNQNTGTYLGTTNTDTGPLALQGWKLFNAGSGDGIFGLAGTGYAPIPLITNRMFINANTALSGIAINNEGSQPIVFGIASAEKMRVHSNGNVGIGTITPGFPLTFANTLGDKIALFGQSGNNYGFGIQSLTLQIYTDFVGADIAFGYGRSAAFTETLRIKGNGKVGIGKSNPQATLDVAGDVLVDGNIAAKYQDVAEWVPARQPLIAGTVVSLDATRSNAVVASTRAYDPHVAGVISAQPGVILGEAGVGKVLVATTGRVKVKVDATRHPIKIGDLLVTSGTSGVAKRSQPIRVAGVSIHRPGTIIGKALEPLTKGQGEILVLLSLQ